jgi:hypothetical protein
MQSVFAGAMSVGQQAAAALSLRPSEEQREIADLHDLFGGARGSPIPVGLYVKFEVSNENLAKAEQARKEREMRNHIREENQKFVNLTTAERKAKVSGKSTQAMHDYKDARLEAGRELRASKAEWDLLREKEKQKLATEVKVKVDHARGNDKRLDGLEESAHEAARKQATEARRARIQAARSFRTNLTSEKKERVQNTRAQISQRTASAWGTLSQTKRSQAEEKRLAAAEGKAKQQAEEQERLRKVTAQRAATLESHRRAARARQAVLKMKQMEGEKADRTASLRITRAKNDLLEDNRQRRLAQFSSRYVSGEQGALFDSSQFRHYYLMDRHAEEEIAAANADLLARIKAMAARTDNDVRDDLAGAGRRAAASASKVRKEAEASKLTQQNADMRQKIKSTKSVTDVDITDDEAGAGRVKAAADSKARKEAEASELAKQNAEAQARIKSTKAATDNDITDDAAGMARAEAGGWFGGMGMWGGERSSSSGGRGGGSISAMSTELTAPSGTPAGEPTNDAPSEPVVVPLA